MDCGERIYIESLTRPRTAVAYCCRERGHEGKHELAGHIAYAYGVDRWGRLPEGEKEKEKTAATEGEEGKVEVAPSK